jgi:hypothetical protein
MLLGRVIEHVREQNWTAVGIDFAIVVIGVFVGIQVSNWNEERETSRKGAIFSERLRADLREENWRYQFLNEYYRDVHAAAQKTADALSGKTALSSEEFLINAYRASQYKQGASRRATYDQLISTGNIGLIQDEDLLRTAVRAYSIATIDHLVREGVESRYRELFRMSIDSDVQRTLGKHCGDRYIEPGDFKGIAEVLDYPCTTGLPGTVIDAAAETLRADPRTLQFLRVRIADLETRLVDLTSNNRDVFQGLQEVADSRRRSREPRP